MVLGKIMQVVSVKVVIFHAKLVQVKELILAYYVQINISIYRIYACKIVEQENLVIISIEIVIHALLNVYYAQKITHFLVKNVLLLIISILHNVLKYAQIDTFQT